jgi:DNA recombination protein RmuC
MTNLLYLSLGLALGGLIGWLIAWRRAAAPTDARLEAELRHLLAQREAELGQVRDQLSHASTARATAEARVAGAETSLAEQRERQEQSLAAARQAQDKALSDLRDAFKALSADALKQTQPEFLRLANETLAKFQEAAKGDLAQRQEAISGVVKPLEEQLKVYQQRLAQSETAQSTALGEVKQHLESLAQHSQSLSSETLQLRRVLSSNQARGRWGEETLRRVVESAGLSAHCDFSEQAQSDDKKPDLIVRLPGQRVIIVDSKVPDLDFLNAVDNADASKRAEILGEHAAKLRTTIKALAERDYPRQFPGALDHVVLFLPAESLFSTALEGDPDLIIWAENKGIYLATPASFIAVLRTISFIWQQQDQTENAREIAAAAQELYSRVVKFTEHFDKIRAGLERANTAFNEAAASYQSRVRPAGDKLAELGGGASGTELPDVPPLDHALRLPPAV